MEQKVTGYPSIDKPWLKYYSEEAINAPLPECTMYDYIWQNNKDNLDDIALIYFNKKITYRKMFEMIDKTAKALKAYGVKSGDIISVSMPTLPETIYLLYAINKIGAIANMIDPRTSAEGIKDYVEEVKSQLFFVVDVAYPKIKNICDETDTKQIIAVSPADSLPKFVGFLYQLKNKPPVYNKSTVTFNEFIEKGKEFTSKTGYKYAKNTPVAIVHTGGTTGKPKGVILTNDNLNCAAFQCSISGIDFKRSHSWLNIMPPFIAYGVGNGLHLPLSEGMRTILIPQFNPDEFDKLLLKYKPNHMVGVPSHYENIINSKKLNKKDLSYIIAPTVGGDTMDYSLEEKVNKFFSSHNCKYNVTKGYGMTEVSAAVSVCLSNECNKIGSVGAPFSHTIISIFDSETGDELKYNELGEVCIRGPNTMLGYYEDKISTDNIIKTHKDGKQWIHSGDIGYMTEDGLLFIVDRIKRMIIRHDGFKIFPSQLEKVCSKHKDIVSCCAVGVSDKNHSQGKLPVVFLVANDSVKKEILKEELRKMCANELPEYAQPVDFIFIDSLPLTPIGKVDYKALEKECN